MKFRFFALLVMSTFTLLVNAQNTEFAKPPGVVIYNSKAVSHKYIGSPSITILNNGTYIASHDQFGDLLSDSFIYESKDKGETWTRIAEIKHLNWGKLFTKGKDLFLLGVRPKGKAGYGDVVILKSLDGGHNWSSPIDGESGLLLEGFYHTAPVPVVFDKGKIWKAMESRDQLDGWGNFSAFVMSVNTDVDLLKAENWSVTNKLNYDEKYLKGASAWLEGNVVAAKDGSLKNILRLHYPEDDKAAMLDVAKDDMTISFNQIIDLPGATKKFHILYDKKSKKYWTLSNHILKEDRGGNVERTRNTIALAYSNDLKNWQINLLIPEMLHQVP